MSTSRAARMGALASAFILLPGPMAGQELRYSGSIGYSTGDYIFTERTQSFAFVNGLSWRADRLGIAARLPIVLRNSRVLSYLHGVPVPTGGPDNGVVRRRQPGDPVHMGHGRGDANGTADSVIVTGIGDFEAAVADPIAGVSFEVMRGTGTVRTLEASAQVKAPLSGVDSGIGTGAWDASMGGSVALGSGRALLFLDAAWWWLGDMPDLELRDYLEYGAGLGLAVGDRWSMLASVGAATRMIDVVDPPASLSLALARRGGGGSSVSAGVGVGLTESAADFSLFLGWGFDLRAGR